jgi:putative transcriptional regulator
MANENPLVGDRAPGALAPGFLLAPPSMSDANFDKTLVLLAAHEDAGSMGFIVNRPSEMKLHALLEELEITPRIDDRVVMLGGPVSGFSGFVLYEHDPGLPLAPGIEVSDRISVSPSREILESAARGQLKGRFELLLGYAGWAPEQLDGELVRGGWLHAPFDAELLFDVPVEERWQEAYARLGVNPAGFITVPGGAQA